MNREFLDEVSMRIMKIDGIRLRRLILALVAGLLGIFGAVVPIAASAFQDHGAKPGPERVYVHTAKSFYMPGEILWFRLYLQDAVRAGVADWSDVAYVELLNASGVPALRAKVDMRSDQSQSGSFYLTPDLPSGAYTLVAYTSLMKAAGSKSFFKQEIELLNPFLAPSAVSSANGAAAAYRLFSGGTSSAFEGPLKIEARPDALAFGTRDRVDIALQTMLDQVPVSADVSVSVFKVDALQEEQALEDIQEVESGIDPNGGDYPEQRYHRMRFKVTHKTNHTPLPGEDVLLAVPGPHHKLYTARTDEQGEVSFYVKDLFGSRQVAIRLMDGRDSNVELISPFYEWTDADGQRAGRELRVFEDALRDEILEYSLNVQSENSFFARERAEIREPQVDTLPFYGDRAVVYRLDDYTRFVRMEEVLREYIPEVRLQRRGGDYQFRVVNDIVGHYFQDSPLILVDGVPITKENDVVAFDPLKIEKISIVTRRYFLGEVVYDGVINFSTYGGVLQDFPLESAVTLIPYEALQAERLFFSPEHDGTDSRIGRMPDTRQQLYWNPSVPVDASGVTRLSFYTSDVPGDYVIEVRGRSADGKMGWTTARFRVD